MRAIDIRPETFDDIDAIREVNVAAFRDHPVSNQTEHLIVDALRDAGALRLSLVAVRNSQVVGHVAFSRARVGESDEGWYLLGPIAVLPVHQGEGIGTALVESGLEQLRDSDAAGCVLVGDVRFYGRFGFTAFPRLVYTGVPQEFVLGLPFEDVAPRGRIRAHPAFEIDADAEKAKTLRPIASLISKSEKALQKLRPDTWQHKMLRENLEALHMATALIEDPADATDFSADDMEEALDAVASMIERTEKSQTKFEVGTSQHTLQRNRLAALHVAQAAITTALKAEERAERGCATAGAEPE